MHDPLPDHDGIAKVPPCSRLADCHGDGGVHAHVREQAHEHGRGRFRHEHAHGDVTHAHDGRPHVHMPDGTIRYLEEGELPSAPKRRRSPSEE